MHSGALPVIMQGFAQEHFRGTPEFVRVEGLAAALLAHMNDPPILAAIQQANAPAASSGEIQSILLLFLEKNGFANESKGLFSRYETSAVRPDYYCKLGETGILLEVERGKTTINNMDFLDFWKCHLCEHANYLFLVVPQELRQNEGGGRLTKPYNAVVKRLGSFFRPRNYTNVRGLFVFGY